MIVVHAHGSRADDLNPPSPRTIPASVALNCKLDFSMLSEGCLYKPTWNTDLTRRPAAAASNSCVKGEPLQVHACITNTAASATVLDAVQKLPLLQHAILHEEFERCNAPQPLTVGKAAPNTATNRPVEPDDIRLQVISTASQSYTGNLFDYRADGPDPHSLIAISKDYKVVYFPIACASFQKHCLTFDFDRVLGHVFGPENVSPVFNGSKLGVARGNGGLRFSLMLVF